MTTRRMSVVTEPVTTAELKTLIPLSGNDFDLRLAALIPALRQEAEQITRRALARSTWRLQLDAFPPAEIRLLWPNLVSVDSIEYVDTTGATQTLAPGAYFVDTHSEPGWVLPAAGTSWPSTYATANAVTVNYTAGAGASSPETLKLWIAARCRADLDGCADEGSRRLLNGLLDHLVVYV